MARAARAACGAELSRSARGAVLPLALAGLLAVGPQLRAERWRGLPVLLSIGGIVLLRQLLVFRRWSDEIRRLPLFVGWVCLLLFVLFVENFSTWAVSAWDLSKYEYSPLQDNVYIALKWACDRWSWFRPLLLAWRVDMHWLLFALVGLCLAPGWEAVRRSGFGMATRAMRTICIAHAIRTAAFLVTVLPSPQHNCYARSFPRPPADPWEFVRYGLSVKRGSGCNDLVVSGHGIVYATVPLALSEYCGGPAAFVAWAAVVKLCLQETLEKTHYSVDMLLAVVLAALVWRTGGGREWDAVLAKREPGAPRDPLPLKALAAVFGIIAIVFVGVKGV